MNSSQIIIPLSTHIGANPQTFCRRLDASVFAYPFFDDGVGPAGRWVDDKIQYALDAIETTGELLAIKGFIFHTSHCGSTLLARMLNSSERVRVVSEPEAINGLLLSYLLHKLSKEETAKHLDRILRAYCQRANAEESVVFKLTSWNIFTAELFQTLYPAVPWLYLDRPTEQVVASLMKSDGGMEQWWNHPVDIFRRLFVADCEAMETKTEYLRQLVENHRERAFHHQNKYMKWLHYPDFADDLASAVLAHFQLDFSQEELTKANEQKQFDSKSGQLRNE